MFLTTIHSWQNFHLFSVKPSHFPNLIPVRNYLDTYPAQLSSCISRFPSTKNRRRAWGRGAFAMSTPSWWTCSWRLFYQRRVRKQPLLLLYWEDVRQDDRISTHWATSSVNSVLANSMIDSREVRQVMRFCSCNKNLTGSGFRARLSAWGRRGDLGPPCPLKCPQSRCPLRKTLKLYEK